MDFELSDDQEDLRQGARELLDGLAGPAQVRSVVDAGTGIDRALWDAMAKQGWTAIALGENQGGLGLGMVEVAILSEELGGHVAPAPFISTVLALGAVSSAGRPSHEAEEGRARRDADLERWTARLARGESIGCVAWSSSSGAVQAQSAGGKGGDGWLLRGRPDPVLYAPEAEVAVIVADVAPGERGVFAMEIQEDRRPKGENAMDLTRSLGWLELDGEEAIRLGGTSEADRLLDRAVTALSAEMLGAADHVLSMSVDYAKQRVQFGRPIGSFQAVKHRCADMLVDVEGMRSTTYHAAWSVENAVPDALVAASTAKVWCSDASRRVMASGLQVHGGIGFTWEHELHLFLKRSQLDQVSFGDASFHRERIASLLRSKVEAGNSVF